MYNKYYVNILYVLEDNALYFMSQRILKVHTRLEFWLHKKMAHIGLKIIHYKINSPVSEFFLT